MDEKRIVYFSNGDLSVSFYLERFAKIIDSIDPDRTFSVNEMNDALELVNVLKFIYNRLFDRRWNEKYINSIELKGKVILNALDAYFNGLRSTNIFTNLSDVYFDYVDDLLIQISKYRLADNTEPAIFEKALLKSKIHLSTFLKYEYLVKKYEIILRSVFLSNPENFEIILTIFSDSSDSDAKVIIPAVSKADMLVLANQYIDSDDANINYLRILSHKIKGLEKYVIIDPATRLKAIKRARALEEELFGSQPNSGIKIKMAVLSTKEAYDKELEDSAPTDYVDLVDAKWIEKYHDFPTLLNNIQYLYSFFTDDLLSSLPSFPRVEMGVMEPHMGVRTSKHYPDGQFFSIKQRMATMRLKAFADILGQYSITVEDIVDWFFSSYCATEFGIDWLPLGFSSTEESTANKTATIFRIEESIRTQYAVLIENGSIDRELVNLMNTPRIGELKSRLKKRYAYPNDESDIQNTMAMLYSSQSRISYVSEELKGKDFINLILHNDVRLSDFHDYQKPIVQHLLDNNLIIEANNGVLHICDVYTIASLQRLHHYGVSGYYHVDSGEQDALSLFFEDNKVRFGESLFSEQETDYLNFLMNDSVFDNSAGIRNKYQHGTPSYEHEGYYESDYLYAQIVLLLYVIKLNDEFSILKSKNGEEPGYCTVGEDL